MKVTVIGVAGGTGSGKSTLVKRLQEAFRNDDVATLCHDYYYKAHPELTYEERTPTYALRAASCAMCVSVAAPCSRSSSSTPRP